MQKKKRKEFLVEHNENWIVCKAISFHIIKRQNEILWLVAKNLMEFTLALVDMQKNGNFTLLRILCNEMWYKISNKIEWESELYA